MRSSHAVLAALLVVAGLYGAAVVGGAPAAGQSDAPAGEQLVAPDGTNSYVWPYTSRSRSTAGRTLALNVVVYGDPDRVRRGFVDRTGANWTNVSENETVDVSPWQSAHGSERYTYVADSRNGTGQWVAPEYQLAVGTYFGERVHIRAYPSTSGNWTALQAHTEYWDWFRLRHTVTGVRSGAEFVEQDIQDEPFVTAVTRAEYGHMGGGGAGSWVVVEFASAAFLAAAALPLTRRRLPTRDLGIVAGLLGIVLGLRAWGLAAEAVFPGVNPKLFVAAGYPLLVVGPPVLVSVLARDRPAVRVSLLAALGLAVATLLDLTLVGVTQVPTTIVHHRVALAATLGIVAFGTAQDEQRVVAVGLAAWVAALAVPLFGFV